MEDEPISFLKLRRLSSKPLETIRALSAYLKIDARYQWRTSRIHAFSFGKFRTEMSAMDVTLPNPLILMFAFAAGYLTALIRERLALRRETDAKL